jgi:1A family penicillin-binding protein
MARAKRAKSRKSVAQPVFFEAMPATFTPPALMPEAADHFDQGAALIRDAWQRLASFVRSYRWRGLLEGGSAERAQLRHYADAGIAQLRHGLHWGVANVMWAGHSTSEFAAGSIRFGWLALLYGTDAAANYAPPIFADLTAYLRAVRARLASRRAKQVTLMVLAGGLFAVVAIGAVTAVTTMSAYANDISSPAALLAKKKTGTTIVDRNGKVLFEGYGAQSSDLVPFDQIPQTLKDATVTAEDPDFYNHPGFSWRGTARAAWVDLTHAGKVEGGSTLTQQLVKNALLNSNKDISRKYQEILLATKLEQRYSKDQILEMYLNEIYYGQGSSGVQAASQTYFHKPAKQLTLGESALLAGLPLGPSRFDPNFDLSAATGRRDFVLNRMVEYGKISKAQADAAKAQPLKLANTDTPTPAGVQPETVYAKGVQIQAPHFVFYVLNQLRQKYGDDVIEQGGITVKTTLDLTKQQAAEKAVADHVSALAGHHVTNGGLISLDPTNGQILAMVGSVNYNAPGFGNVNVTLSDLQPGSSFKPIAYVEAFKKGWSGATHVDDAPLVLPGGENGQPYVPQNYDGKFRGSVSLRRALANSLNIPALKVLQFAGIHDTIGMAHDLGVTTLNDESRYGLSLVLGGGEVRPIDMATVYANFANGGNRVTPNAILSITDRHGADINKFTTPDPVHVLDNRLGYMITNILSDNNARTEEFGANSPLKLSRPAAAKTGTTNDFRDNWTVGYTPQVVTAVWVGNNDHSPMNNVDGITGAAPIWHDYMEAANAGLPVRDFTAPAGITMARVCNADGGLANPWDPGTDEAFLSDAVPTKRCSSSAPNPQDVLRKLQNQDNNADNPSPNPETPGGGTPSANPSPAGETPPPRPTPFRPPAGLPNED